MIKEIHPKKGHITYILSFESRSLECLAQGIVLQARKEKTDSELKLLLKHINHELSKIPKPRRTK